MSIGARLREARKQAGLTIPDIASRTKIQPALLDAIEREDFERLPGGAVRRGFLRAFAREVGLHPEEIVQAYLAEYEAPPVEPEPPPAPAIQPAAVLSALRPGGWAVALAAIALLIAVVYFRGEPASGELESTPVGMSYEPFAGPDAAPAGLTGSTDNAAPEPLVPLRLRLEATGPVWVDATADGERLVYELIEPGERIQLDAHRELRVRVGDAGAFTYSVNGVAGRTLGGPGRVVDLAITPENYRTYQATPLP